MSVFITGTDTGVGKTHLAVQLLHLLRSVGLSCAGFKPICCGDRQDAELLLAASSEGVSIDEVNPIWFRTPVAPFTASQIEQTKIDPEHLGNAFAEISRRFEFLVVEGVGGWLVPLRADYFVSDLAAKLDLPVLVVAANRLGCLNHTLLTLESIRAKGLACAGVVLNAIEDGAGTASATNAQILESMIAPPLLPMLNESLSKIPDQWRTALDLNHF